MKKQRKTGGIVAGEAQEEHARKLLPPARKKDGKAKGARLGPSRMPRREEATDAAIGKGEEMLRPRKSAEAKPE